MVQNPNLPRLHRVFIFHGDKGNAVTPIPAANALISPRKAETGKQCLAGGLLVALSNIRLRKGEFLVGKQGHGFPFAEIKIPGTNPNRLFQPRILGLDIN